MRNILKAVRIGLAIILLLCMIFLLFKMLSYSSAGYTENIKIFTDEPKLYGTEKYYMKGDYLYTINTSNGSLYIFNKKGELEKGFQLPTNGGDIWTGMSDKVYIYCVRKQLLVEINDIDDVNPKNIFYDNQNTFYESLGLTDKNLFTTKKNMVSFMDGNNKIEITLNIKMDPFTSNVCIVLFAICFVCFLMATGLLKKLLEPF